MATTESWEQETQEAINEACEKFRADYREQGREQGRAQGRAQSLITVLETRGVAMTEEARARILAESDAGRLDYWLKNALAATTIADVFG